MSLVNKVVNIVLGSINIFFITNLVSPAEQGYYYTFSSLILFQVLFDLGFGSVLTQFISHEWAFLSLNKNEIRGSEEHLERLKVLVQMGKKWYRVIATLFFIIVGCAGLIFLHSKSSVSSSYSFPWILLCLIVSFSITALPYRFFLEGSNQIDKSQRILLYGTLSGYIASWICLYYGAGIYILVIYSTCNLGLTLIGICKYAKPFIKLNKPKALSSISFWKTEFFSQQWKIGLSTIAGYFMYQLFVPLIFHYDGPIAAGKMGATLQLFNAILSVGYIFSNISAPNIGILGAKKQYKKIITIVNKVSLISCIVTACVTSSILILMFIIAKLGYSNFVDRFIDIKSMSLFFLATIIMQRINVETIAVRFQKKEPYLLCSIISAIITCFLMFFLGKKYGVEGIIYSFWIGTGIVGFVWSHLVYKEFFRKLLDDNKLAVNQ